MAFADKSKELREEYNLTQLQLAQALHLSRSCISMLEIGKNEPTATTLISYANYFNLPIDDLLERTETNICTTTAPTAGVMHDSIGLTEKEKALLKAFKNLLPETQDFVLRTAQSLSDKSNVKTLNKN